MNRMKKEFLKRGIIYEASDEACMKGAEFDESEKLLTINDYVIVTIYYTMVLNPMFKFYDRKTFEPLGCQDVFKDDMCFCDKRRNPWLSAFYI